MRKIRFLLMDFLIWVMVILWKDLVCEGTDYQHGRCHSLSQGGGQRQGQYGGGTGGAFRGQAILQLDKRLFASLSAKK